MTRKEILYILTIDPKWSILRHLVLQMLILLITSVVFLDRANNTFCFDQNFIKGWSCYFLSINFAIYTNIYILTPKYMMTGRLSRHISITFVISTILALIINGSHFYFCPPQGLSKGAMVAFFIMLMLSSYIIYAMMVTCTSSFLLLQVWIRNKKRQEELEINTLNAKLKILRNQINPHFLFNTINNANMMLKKDQNSASFILDKLRDLLGYQLSNATKNLVLLNDEIKLLDDYLHLEKIRRDNFSYEINTEGNTENVLLPPLLFIIFVENAVKYNPNDGSKIIVSFKRDEEGLLFLCQNTKSEHYEKSDVGGIGIANVKKRLELLFPTSHSLEVEDGESMFTVKLSIKV